MIAIVFNKNTDRTREGLYLISRPMPVPCARDSVTRACTDSRVRKPLQLRDKSATLLRAWVVIVRHLDYILFTRARGRALAAISGEVPSVSRGVWRVCYQSGGQFPKWRHFRHIIKHELRPLWNFDVLGRGWCYFRAIFGHLTKMNMLMK